MTTMHVSLLGQMFTMCAVITGYSQIWNLFLMTKVHHPSHSSVKHSFNRFLLSTVPPYL